jgi:hypothetical protein
MEMWEEMGDRSYLEKAARFCGSLVNISITNPTNKTVYIRWSSNPNDLMTMNAGLDGAGINFQKQRQIQWDGQDMIHSGNTTTIIPTTKMTKVTFSSNTSFPPLPFSWDKHLADGTTYTIAQAKVDAE